MSKTNFRGEPIHGPEFMAQLAAVRTALIGQKVKVRDDIPRPVPWQMEFEEEVPEIVVDVVPTPDYDSFNLVMADRSRWGAEFSKAGERVMGGPQTWGFKVEVLSGRFDRWVEIL